MKHEHQAEDEAAPDDDGDYDDEEPGEDEEDDESDRAGDAASVGGGCFRTMLLAMAFWMAVAVAALGFCAVFGAQE